MITTSSQPPGPLVSCVIPSLNEAATIAACLEQFSCLPGRWEILVADSGSNDGTVPLAASVMGVEVIAAPPGRGAGMNAGAALASGVVLLFLHADTRLPPDAWRLVTRALADPRTSATAFHLRLDRHDGRFQLVPLASRLRMPLQRTFFGDQAIAVRRVDFAAVGGFRELALMEDVDLSRRLRRRGRLQILPATVTTSARRFERHGVLRTLAFMTGLQLAYTLGVPAERLASWYAAVR